MIGARPHPTLSSYSVRDCVLGRAYSGRLRADGCNYGLAFYGRKDADNPSPSLLISFSVSVPEGTDMFDPESILPE